MRSQSIVVAHGEPGTVQPDMRANDTSRAFSGEHLPALDGLRGIAILLVLAHGFDVIQTHGIVDKIFDLLLDSGWIGVQLFFVLSGFLITGILLDTRRDPHFFRNFYARRTLRIFPLYYGVLLIAFAIAPLVISLPAGYGSNQMFLWTYTANFAAPLGHDEPAFPHFWSLCVEEQFYLAWPLIVYLLRRRGVVLVSLLLTCAAIAARIVVRERFGTTAAYMFLFCRMDALVLGALAAALIRNEDFARRLRNWAPAIVAGLGLSVLLFGEIVGRFARTGAAMQTYGYTIIALGFAIVLLASIHRGSPATLLSYAPLRRVGRYSYGMYVFYAPLHLFVGLPLLESLQVGSLGRLGYTALAMLITFFLAALSYHAFERPFLKLKDRFASSRAAADASNSPPIST